ncbi:MAG: hypothetical protein K1060chlam5_00375 [Candidatus Anoxychlamydiales bacterium]|nr:hypothetical protein [Candidatus Anoxychlamydiales bacterium]
MSLQISCSRALFSNPGFKDTLKDPNIPHLVKYHYLESIPNPWQALIDGKFKFIEDYIHYLEFHKLRSATPLHIIFNQNIIPKNDLIILVLVKEAINYLQTLESKRSLIKIKDLDNQTVIDKAIWSNRADVIIYLLSFFTKEEKFEFLRTHDLNTQNTILHTFAQFFNIFDLFELFKDLDANEIAVLKTIKNYYGCTFIELWNQRELSENRKL